MSDIEICSQCHQPIFPVGPKMHKTQKPIKVTYHDIYKHLTIGEYVFIFKHQMQVMRKKEKATGYSVLHERYPLSERDKAIEACNELNKIHIGGAM